MQDFLLRWDGARRAISCVLFSTLLVLSNLTLSTPAYSFSSTSTLGQLVVNPGSISFGNVALGSSQAQSLILTNSGGSDLTVTKVSANNSAFTISGLTYPLTLGVGRNASCVVTFAPQVGGSTTGTVSILVYSKRRYRRTM